MPNPNPSIYQLKITLKDITPPIYRRVEVPASTSLNELHWIIQSLMDWNGDHLHKFAFGKRYFSDPDRGPDYAEDEYNAYLDDLAKQPNTKFLYEYDFGDSWIHEILVEKIKPPEQDAFYPRCTGGNRLAPLDDSGGPWGWENLLEIIDNPKHPEYAERREFLGLRRGELLDTESFHIKIANKKLRNIAADFMTRDDQDAQDKELRENINQTLAHRGLRLISYKISYNALNDTTYDLPPDIQENVNDMYIQMQRKPKKAIPSLLQWLEKYPNAARLLNYLGAAYSLAGMDDKARETAEQNFRANPDYLFAKLNYAEIFLRKKDFPKVKEIMQNKWDLSLHYPNRDVFHITEVLSFFATAARYMIGINDLPTAQTYADILTQAAPNSEESRVVNTLLAAARLLNATRKRKDQK